MGGEKHRERERERDSRVNEYAHAHTHVWNSEILCATNLSAHRTLSVTNGAVAFSPLVMTMNMTTIQIRIRLPR